MATQHFFVDDEYSKPNELPKKSLIHLDKARRIVFYNSLASERVQVVTLRVSHYNVQVKTTNPLYFYLKTFYEIFAFECVKQVTNADLKAIRVQISPVFVTPHQLSTEEFDISFLVSIPAVGMATYTIRKSDESIETNS